MSHPITFDPATGTYHTRHERSDPGTVADAVVVAVAKVTVTPPVELPPLTDAVDAEALDDLFDPVGDGASGSVGHVAFTYQSHRVVVAATGAIVLDPQDDRP